MPLREACGVVGISTTTPVLHNQLVGLRALQHRGQESAGVALWDDGHLTRRGMGLVSEALTNFETHFYDAKTGIGHVRYSTAGSSSLRNAQPITASFATGELSLAHNGTISNQQELREHWETEGAAF
ncbi:MAG: class II glutamine amidotransferase, partial [Candidatus Thermoplasmatota archaeon]|nr:class II glutamine amidotransferase [Candidatus Thermoplasmatota archaeon]